MLLLDNFGSTAIETSQPELVSHVNNCFNGAADSFCGTVGDSEADGAREALIDKRH